MILIHLNCPNNYTATFLYKINKQFRPFRVEFAKGIHSFSFPVIRLLQVLNFVTSLKFASKCASVILTLFYLDKNKAK